MGFAVLGKAAYNNSAMFFSRLEIFYAKGKGV